MRKNILFFIIIFVVVLAELLVFLLYYGGLETITSYFHKTAVEPSGIILFYGTPCQNCVTVDNYIRNNNVQVKVSITKLEVLHSSTNASILADKSQVCGLNPTEVGVPLLWVPELIGSKRCIIGSVDVINFFKQKMAKK